MTFRRFYAPPDRFIGRTATLSDDEAHHARHVVRVRVGDLVRVFDGIGSEFEAVVAAVRKREVELELGDRISGVAESPLDLTLAAALVKPERFEWAIQKAVELGVSRIVPLVTEHTETGSHRAFTPARKSRWERIVLEAAKQSERRVVPDIEPPAEFDKIVEGFQAVTARVMFVERAAHPWADIEAAFPVAPTSAVALVGPEGGWSPAELLLADRNEVFQATLGPRILRAETACVLAVGLLQRLWGDFR